MRTVGLKLEKKWNCTGIALFASEAKINIFGKKNSLSSKMSEKKLTQISTDLIYRKDLLLNAIQTSSSKKNKIKQGKMRNLTNHQNTQ